MTAFDKAWNVLKMGTYEEEERDMGHMPGRIWPENGQGKKLTPEEWDEILRRYGGDKNQPNPYDPYKSYPPPKPYRDKNHPGPYDPYRNPPPNKPPYEPPNPYGGDDWATCPDCGQRYKTGMDMVTGKPKQCPCKDGGTGVAPNPYVPPPGAPPAPFQRQSIGFPKDWQTTNMTSNPPQ